MRKISFALFIGFWSISAQSKHRVESFTVNNMKQALIEVENKQLDLAGVDYQNKVIDIVISGDETLTIGGKRGVLLPQSFRGTPDQRYLNYDDIREALYNLEEKYSDIVDLKVIGTTEEGREILAIKISDNASVDENEPVVLFNGMHHAREIMTPEVVIDTAEYLTANYDQNPEVASWVDNNETWIIPMVNPDGSNYVWTADNLWRKNRRGGYGVDLNRNYSFNWNACGGSSSNRRSDTYRGPSAVSEPETRALMKLVETTKPSIAISYHSYSELVLFPYGCRKLKAQDPGLREFGNELAAAIPNDYGKGTYRAGTPYEILYQADGGDIDWMYGEHGVYAYVVELNSRRLGFQPPYTWREKTVKKLRNAWKLAYKRIAESSIDVEISSQSKNDIKSVNIISMADDKLIKNVSLEGLSYQNILTPRGMLELEFIDSSGKIVVRKTVILSDRKLSLAI